MAGVAATEHVWSIELSNVLTLRTGKYGPKNKRTEKDVVSMALNTIHFYKSGFYA